MPITTRQALSNVVQKRGRLLLTALTLTLAAAAFMGIYAMFSSVTSELEDTFAAIDFDLVVTPTQPRSMEEMQPLLSEVDTVAEIYPSVDFSADLEGYTAANEADITAGSNLIGVSGIDTTSDTWDITYNSGTGWDNDPNREGLVMTTVVADAMNKKVGDHVVLTAGGQTHEYEIIGIFDFPESFLVMRWQDVSQLAGFVDDAGNPLPTSFAIRVTQNDPSARDVDKTISKITDSLMGHGITAGFTNQIEVLDTITQQFNMFNMIFQIASGVMALVGAIGLLTTLSMAVYERQKEIGVMRSIGAGSSTISFQFLVEGILVGVLAWIAAIPLSVLLAKALYSSLGFDFFEFSYPLSTLGLGLIGMLVIATVASLWPSLAAARKTVSDILRYQ
jgi:putative ABC transport system permease protein